MGLFWEVPIMLGLVYLGKALGKRRFWNGEPLGLRPVMAPVETVPVEVTDAG
jgi:hypothetical protein